VLVGGIQLGGALVGIESVVGLVVARLVQRAKVIPHLGDVGIEADGPGVSVQSIPVLVDLVVENTDGAPKGRVSAIAVDRLLVRFVCFRVFLLRHVAAP
jgi:hypothetical protein